MKLFGYQECERGGVGGREIGEGSGSLPKLDLDKELNVNWLPASGEVLLASSDRAKAFWAFRCSRARENEIFE